MQDVFCKDFPTKISPITFDILISEPLSFYIFALKIYSKYFNIKFVNIILVFAQTKNWPINSRNYINISNFIH